MGLTEYVWTCWWGHVGKYGRVNWPKSAFLISSWNISLLSGYWKNWVPISRHVLSFKVRFKFKCVWENQHRQDMELPNKIRCPGRLRFSLEYNIRNTSSKGKAFKSSRYFFAHFYYYINLVKSILIVFDRHKPNK